jgi:hypothetical protein
MNPGYPGPESFVPALAYITGITQALNASVTFSETPAYSPGELLSFRVSKPFGMQEINNQVGTILSIIANVAIVDINTLGYTSFIYPVSGKNTPPVAVPAGSSIIPGTFPPTINLIDVFDCVGPS